MIWSKSTDETQDDAVTAPDSRVVYVNRRIPGAHRGDVITVEWSAHWQRHEDSGNVSVVRDEVVPQYAESTDDVYSDDSPAIAHDTALPLHDDGVDYDADSED